MAMLLVGVMKLRTPCAASARFSAGMLWMRLFDQPVEIHPSVVVDKGGAGHSIS